MAVAELSAIARRGRAASVASNEVREVAGQMRRLARPLLRTRETRSIEETRISFSDVIPGEVGDEVPLRVDTSTWCGPNAISILIPKTKERICLSHAGMAFVPTGETVWDESMNPRTVFREATIEELAPYHEGLRFLSKKHGIPPDEHDSVL